LLIGQTFTSSGAAFERVPPCRLPSGSPCRALSLLSLRDLEWSTLQAL